MVQVYVAGKNMERAKSVMDAIRQNGDSVIFDWLIDLKEETDISNIDKAFKEREGVRNCDILIYLWESDQESARYEAGMAMGLGKPIIICRKHKSFFFNFPEIITVGEDSEIIPAIKKLSYKSR
jgi:nucleoside 2-deoxyribosyltransferase